MGQQRQITCNLWPRVSLHAHVQPRLYKYDVASEQTISTYLRCQAQQWKDCCEKPTRSLLGPIKKNVMPMWVHLDFSQNNALLSPVSGKIKQVAESNYTGLFAVA